MHHRRRLAVAVVDMPLDVLLGKTPRMHRLAERSAIVGGEADFSELDIAAALHRVLRFPAVGSTIMLGPVGRVAHPLSTSADITARPRRHRGRRIFPSYRSGGLGDGTTCIHPPGHSLTYG